MKIENAKEAQKSDDQITKSPACDVEEDPRLGHVFSPGKASETERSTARPVKRRKARNAHEVQQKKLEVNKESEHSERSQSKRDILTKVAGNKSKRDYDGEEDEQSICSDF